MVKKILTFFLLISVTALWFIQAPAFAAGTDCSKIQDSTARAECLKNPNNYDSTKQKTPGFSGSCRGGFLGLVSWDCGVNISDEASLKTGIWQIAANVATDITIIAAYLVLGYVIYGGYLYIFSSGEPTKIASGKKTLTHAFIGLAIVMSAYVIMSSIRFALLGAGGKFNCDFMSATGANCISANKVISNAISWAISIGGVVAVIFLVYGGISYTTSAGEPNKLSKAKQTIIYALIGLAIVALAEIITAFVSSTIRDADNAVSNSLYHQTINPKEQHEIHLT